MARIVFPNQLFKEDYGEKLYLLEHPRFFTDFRFHKQKLVLHRASMKNFEKETDESTKYLNCEDDMEKPFKENKKLNVYDPEDHKLKDWLKNMAEKHGTEINIEESPMFLTSMEWNRNFFKGNKYFQFNYYRAQRKRLNILLNKDGSPEGGKWSYDPENREKLPKNHETPKLPDFNSEEVEEAKNYIEENFSENPGSLENFIHPISRRQALYNLNDFLKNRIQNFGKYQDAIDSDVNFGYHSLISSSINMGIITPKDVIEKTQEYKEKNSIPLSSVEGFLRQIIGWREYIRAIYRIEENMSNSNYWSFKNKIPKEFYTAETGLKPIDESIERVNQYAYTHHIERLMVLGNIMMLLEIDPDEVYKWFMEMFIDSYDWVMVPNVYGMSQYSFEGMMTKPYISSSNYIKKMSNYSKGEWQEKWDGLFWKFIKNHKKELSSIYRMAFMTKQVEKMDDNKLKEHLTNAKDFMESLSF
ncbi:MAG: cryptochrome/photolyase family protein [Candidatus Pacearchaeota archaeon]